MKYLYFFLFVLFLHSCSSIQYKPYKTPKEINTERKLSIQNALKQQFKEKSLTYSSIDFGQTTVIKPPSYYSLDSLYSIKFELERRNKIDKDLETKIKYQQVVVNQDTTPIYYQVEHVFLVKDSSKTEAFFSNVTLNKSNEIVSIKINKSNEINSQLKSFYGFLVLNKSFVYPGSELDESEIAFFDLYKEKLNTLKLKEEDDFLNNILQIMKIAYDNKSLEKSNLIKIRVLQYVQNKNFVSINDQFYGINEILDENKRLLFYQIFHSYLDKNENLIKKVEVHLSPYLELLQILPN